MPDGESVPRNQDEDAGPMDHAEPQRPVEKVPQEIRSILKPSRPDGQPQRDLQNGKAISWVDLHGQELAIVHEFEASEYDESEDGDGMNSDGKSCCVIS